jgi:hypothetical protein
MWLSRGGNLRGELLHGFTELSPMLDCQSLKTYGPRLVTFSPCMGGKISLHIHKILPLFPILCYFNLEDTHLVLYDTVADRQI